MFIYEAGFYVKQVHKAGLHMDLLEGLLVLSNEAAFFYAVGRRWIEMRRCSVTLGAARLETKHSLTFPVQKMDDKKEKSRIYRLDHQFFLQPGHMCVLFSGCDFFILADKIRDVLFISSADPGVSSS